MSIPGRDDLLAIKIAPPVIVERSGSRVRTIDIVLLAARHVGGSLFPIVEWPVSVYVLRPLINDIENRDKLVEGEFENIAWAEVYKSEDDARRKTVTKYGSTYS
jgi:hypothetical protein